MNRLAACERLLGRLKERLESSRKQTMGFILSSEASYQSGQESELEGVIEELEAALEGKER